QLGQRPSTEALGQRDQPAVADRVVRQVQCLQRGEQVLPRQRRDSLRTNGVLLQIQPAQAQVGGAGQQRGAGVSQARLLQIQDAQRSRVSRRQPAHRLRPQVVLRQV